jgi:type I restriction enzyme R subunit
MPDVSEHNFESIIECALLANGPDACTGGLGVIGEQRTPYGTLTPGGYVRRTPDAYDAELCLDPELVVGFVQATQPKEWAKLRKQHGDRTRRKFLRRLSDEIAKRGTLDVLRKGVRDMGAHVRLVYFKPPTGLNPALQKKYRANTFSVIRQFAYSVKDQDKKHRKALDLGLFLNGLPLFTVELKNPLTGQSYRNAIRQYKTTRSDPQEPLFAFKRCLAHFAVDPDEVWFTTELAGDATRFFPFNRGQGRGAGNPPPPPGKFATAYLWEELWAKYTVLTLLEQFVHVIDVLDDKGRKTGEQRLIFPRYHQLDAVRRLTAHARDHGSGERYLIQHSAGSGKSFTIAWLAHQLTTLHDAADTPIFDSIIVVTDRRVLDRQLQRHVRNFQQIRGLVQNVDQGSHQLQGALEAGKRIVVTTLQKFPYISEEIDALPGNTFAVIIDEAHSSQGGEMSKHLKQVLRAGSLEEAAETEAEEGEDWEDRVVEEIRARGHQLHVSFFAFTATPKSKTLELFGTRQPDGGYQAFHLYSMRQAIEERFILDVLANYNTYRAYWRLLKKIEQDPHYDQTQAARLLTQHVELGEHAVSQKVGIIVEHFDTQVAHRLEGQAKAMIVTRSRLHAVRYRQALDAYLQDRGYPYRALVAFSGTVKDPETDQTYTERGMNGGIPETQTADAFKKPEHRFLVVANKFQTGFDEPLLSAMYVDKKLSGVRAVQTLSRLNRPYPGKKTFVLDFANEAETIQASFADYYETTLLSEGTDPNLLYDVQRKLADAHFYTEDEVEHVAALWFSAQRQGLGASGAEADPHHPKIHNALQPVVDRFVDAEEDEREAFRGHLRDYVRLYRFLAQLVPFTDPELETLYVFAYLLLRRLPPPEGRSLPREVLAQVELETYQMRQTHNGEIALEPEGKLAPQGEKGARMPQAEAPAPLSEIVALLNERFGLNVSKEEGETFMAQMLSQLLESQTLADSVAVNTPANAKLTFTEVINDVMQDMLDVNFKFYKLYAEEPHFAEFLRDLLYDRYLREHDDPQGERA